jgi:RNA polymerase sigma-70 factor, ECF subfamily
MASNPVHYPVTPIHLGPPSDFGSRATSCKGDSAEVFGVICERYERTLFRVAQRILKNEADAEDAVQEALLRAYLKMDLFRGEAALYTWLVRIVINTSLMILRKRTRHPHASLDSNDKTGESWVDTLSAAGESAESKAIQGQIQSIVQNAIADLPSGFSALVAEWIAEERTMAELSQQFGITVPATKARILRAKRKVAETVRRRLKFGATPEGAAV